MSHHWKRKIVPESDVFLTEYVDVSENSGTPKSSNLIGFSIINHSFLGDPYFGNTHVISSERSNIQVVFSLQLGVSFLGTSENRRSH